MARNIEGWVMDQKQHLELYRVMFTIAETDRTIVRSLAAGELQFQYYPCGGQEAIAAGVGALLKRDDYMVTTYRGIHDIIAKGTPLKEVLAEIHGRIDGTSKGKGGPMHLSDPNSGLMVTTGIVGAGIPIANGLALAEQLRKSQRVTVVSFGDGATSIGAFHEALNMASVWKLPVVFVCQNNQYAEYTSIPEYTATRDFSKRAGAYEMPGVRVDGNDPVAVYEQVSAAITRARQGGGPTLVEAVCHRLQGHSFGSDEGHMDAGALAKAREAAPVPVFRRRLLASGASETQLAEIEARVKSEIAAALKFAQASAPPAASELYTDIFGNDDDVPDFAKSPPRPAATKTIGDAGKRQILMAQAINEALDIALGADSRVVLLGEDIADPAGGVLKVTAGLSSKHGRDRVRPTPIAEQAIVGAGIGAALAGMRPVPEIMINDFLMVCMDQVANHAAKLRYMSGGRTNVPLTIRTVSAGNVGSFGAQHSQSLEGWLTHTPGIKVVYPSTAYDAKGLLLSCIFDEDPCVFFEAARCYFTPGPVPEGDYRIPLGVADIKRSGTDLSIIGWGWPLADATAAAATLAKDGIDAEIVDLRTLIPLDRATLLESVSKTGRALIVHSAIEFGGYGAELATIIHQALHGRLKAAVARVGARYTPVPFAQSLEALHFPSADRIVAAARKLCQ
jgi:2-oxoisovalerate dehydrogenase E1 component